MSLLPGAEAASYWSIGRDGMPAVAMGSLAADTAGIGTEIRSKLRVLCCH
ncbi:MAG: hypothetical protein ACLUQY_03555 [Weissella confusa]